MNKFQYDDEYSIAVEAGVFLRFEDYEEEEAFAHDIMYGRK